MLNAGRKAEALEYYTQSLELKTKAKSVGEIAPTLSNIARLHFELGRMDEAIRCFDQAIDWANFKLKVC